MSRGPRDLLIVFLRRPDPGLAKTRLIPALGAEGAAEAYRRVCEIVLRNAGTISRPGLVRVAAVEPAEYCTTLAAQLGPAFSVEAQAPGDLGQRMQQAFARGFDSGARRVVLIGSDCPDLSCALLERAFESLATHDVVLGPAVDGGYYLIGLSRPLPAAFEDVPWSRPDTLSTTLSALESERAWVALLPTLRDLDDGDDLAALSADWPMLRAITVD